MDPALLNGYSFGILCGDSSEPLQQQFDQHQRPLIQGDRYGMNAADPSGTSNSSNTVTPVGSRMDAQNLNPVSLQSISRANSTLMPNLSNLHNAQQAVPELGRVSMMI